jgi:hypothetical protein
MVRSLIDKGGFTMAYIAPIRVRTRSHLKPFIFHMDITHKILPIKHKKSPKSRR